MALRSVAVVTALASRKRHRRSAAVAAFAAAALALAACTSGSGGHSPSTGTSDTSNAPTSPASSPSSPVPAAAAVLAVSPAGRTSVNPTTAVSVRVEHGKLTKVTMVNGAGRHVVGSLSADGTSWHTTEVLGYGKTYTIDARAVNGDGKPATAERQFSTLSPDNLTMPTMDRMGGYSLTDGATYGVAIVPVVHFDEPITDKAAAQRALTVTTSSKVEGAWSWTDDQDVAYRPRTYWPSGTSVTVAAHVYGVDVGNGRYGESDESTHFTIGRKQVTIADDNSPRIDKVRVYSAAGKVLRTMNTSMGKHGGEYVNGQYINFYTLAGTYTVLEHDNPAIMSSQSYGLPANAPNGYPPLSVPYSTKISIDGIYLHQYNSTIYDQDNGYDVSEGCLNLTTADASWFYDHSLIGDPVVVHGATGAPTIAVDEGGDWSVPWARWRAGSAL